MCPTCGYCYSAHGGDSSGGEPAVEGSVSAVVQGASEQVRCDLGEALGRASLAGEYERFRDCRCTTRFSLSPFIATTVSARRGPTPGIVFTRQVKSHLDEVVRSTVEQTLKQLLDEKAECVAGARADRRDAHAGSYRRNLRTNPGEVGDTRERCGDSTPLIVSNPSIIRQLALAPPPNMGRLSPWTPRSSRVVLAV